jgi:phosphoglycerate dehydrogenase-like enzyme
MTLVIHPPVDPERLERITEAAGGLAVVNAADEAAALARMPEAEAFFGKITPRLLAAAPKLRWVQAPTASLEHYIFPELVEHPCVLTNMRGLFSDVIADQVMGYILCFARNLHTYVLQAVEAKWAPVGGESARVGFAAGPGTVNDIDRAHKHLADATLGIVGFGAIGRETAERANAFCMRILTVDTRPADRPPHVEALWPVEDLPRLLGESDYVVIAAPHTPRTVGMFGREQFKQMKRDAILINVGRGAIVKLDDLVEALNEGELAGAALDVFETEPLPPEHALWRMPGRVILTPHVAGYSPRIAARHLQVLLDNIPRFARGDELMNIADKREWH